MAISVRLLGCALLCALSIASSARANVETDIVNRALDAGAFVTLPVAFEQNVGQFDGRAKFVARGADYDAFLTARGASIVVGKRSDRCCSIVDVRPLKARAAIEPKGLDSLPGRVNYFIGDDPAGYSTDVRTFARVRYERVYPGIDIDYHGSQGALEYDVIVAPRADPNKIDLEVRGADRFDISPGGSLILHTRSGAMQFDKPTAYQDVDGNRRSVDARYRRLGSNRIGFRLGPYDRSRPLVIDPILALSTNVWGAVKGVAVDSASNIYVVGLTTKTDLLPVAGGYQPQIAGTQDAYVAKLNPSASAAIYTTYLGGRRATTAGTAIAVDRTGSAYIAGTTDSSAFPIMPGAYRSSGFAFVTKLNAAGNALSYSTYVDTAVGAMAVDDSGSVYMTGTSAGIVPTPGALQPTRLAPLTPYVAKLNAAGSALAYATYLGGSANDDARSIAVDSAGNAYVVGIARSGDFPTRNAIRSSLGGPTDAFVAKVNPSGTALVYSTYLGGSGEERGFGVAVDDLGQAVAVGWTQSTDFPITPGAFQPRKGYHDSVIINAFIAKLRADGTSFVYSSYLGGAWCFSPTVYQCFGFFGADEGMDVGTSVAVDAAGFAYLGGYATSTQFPLVDSPQPMTANGDVWHVPMIAKISPLGDRVVYAAVLGTKAQDGTLYQVATDGNGGVVGVGSTPFAPAFPLTANTVLGGGAGYLFKFAHGIYPTTLESSPNPASRAQTVTLRANVMTPSVGGLVTFKDGTTTLGTANVTNGIATLAVTLPPGIHKITAINGADGKASPTYFQIVSGQ